jgi:Trk-type K+ transport system membrane component
MFNMDDIGRLFWRGFQAIRPSFLSKEPHFNFITAHYFWIISLSILGSVIMYGAGKGNISYMDALFFATGANTQAGLNTVDVNTFTTFQQVVVFLLAMTSNPITINSAVVFLRLYWFEKRFQGFVKESRQRRTSTARTRSKAKSTPAVTEKGVNGRNIRVMHNTAQASRMNNDGTVLNQYTMNGRSDYELANGTDPEYDNPKSPRDPHITFADKVTRSDTLPVDGDRDTPLPSIRADAEHIAFLERQRKKDKSVLRIPGPRDADRGALPEELDDDDGGNGYPLGHEARKRRGSSFESHLHESPPPTSISSNPDRPQTITIAEPARPKRDEIAEEFQAIANTLSALKVRRPRGNGEKLHRQDTATEARNPLHRIKTALSQNKDSDPMPYLSWHATIGRNSEFLDLTEEQREELGGIEYRSLKTLAVIMTFYFWGFWLFGAICLIPWILHNNDYYGQLVGSYGQNLTWWAFFTSSSAFTDLGFTLTPDSMNSFNTARFPLLLMSFLIIIGNTGFPIMLRFCIWVFHLAVPRGSGLWEELRFLLDHPRRCFTLLFPSTATWWLFLILVILNGVDLVFFIILDLGVGPVSELPLDIRFLDGWFQAASTRTAGFGVVNLGALHPAVQTSYMIMMYISVFPIAISVRRTNVYEERALGLYGAPGANTETEDTNENGFSYVGAHLRRQLSFDLWYIFIGFFILSISEGPRLMSGDFSMFAVLFEIVSAYGTVGLSLGYTGINASLSSQFTVVGKLVIVAMMLRGRHRGLPYGLDRAILLPSEALDRQEAQDDEARLQRRQSVASFAPNARPGSLIRGRSRSTDRRNVLAQFLHPGPAYLGHSISKADTAGGLGRFDTFKRTTTEPVSDDNVENSNKPGGRPKRASTQPDIMH